MSAKRSVLATWLVCAAALTSACAQPRGRHVTPETTLTTFARALERGDAQAAYGLMSQSYRARVPLAQFKRQMAQNRAEAKALATSLGRRSGTRSYAEVTLADGSRVQLENRGGRFYVDTPLPDFYSQATPRDTLASFVRAVERSRWDVVLGLMPDADRQGLDAVTLGKNLEAQAEELTRMVALLKASQDAPIEVVGDRATMPYGESFTARFVRENGVWKLEDPE